MRRFISYRLVKPMVFTAAITAMLAFAATTHAQPAGFGNANNMGSLATNNPRGITLTRSSVTGFQSYFHTYKFTVTDRTILNIRLNAVRPDVAIALFDSNGRFLLLGKPASPRINTTVNKGLYYVRTFGTPKKMTRYQLFVTGKPAVIKVPTPTNRFPTTTFGRSPVLTPGAVVRPTTRPAPRPTPRPTTPRVNPVGRISYGGLLYNDHSSNSRLSPTTIGVGGMFRVTSSTMRFSGAGVRTLVALEDVNRRPGSFGVTRFGLRSFRANGNTITIAGPNLALFKNRDFRVVIVTYVNGRPTNYTMPGVLRIR